jgi:hypothetical protein
MQNQSPSYHLAAVYGLTANAVYGLTANAVYVENAVYETVCGLTVNAVYAANAVYENDERLQTENAPWQRQPRYRPSEWQSLPVPWWAGLTKDRWHQWAPCLRAAEQGQS